MASKTGSNVWRWLLLALMLLLLALGSQVVGQGCLVYALGQVPPLVVGLALLTQPAVSAIIGWLFYNEVMTSLDFLGAFAIGAALAVVVFDGLHPALMRSTTSKPIPVFA